MFRTPPRGVLAAAAALALSLGCASAANADTFNVNTTTDNSDPCTATSCSLRGAIEDASESTPGADVINVPAGRYYQGDQAGPLHIHGKITLVGAGVDQTIIDAVGHARVIQVDTDGDLDASKLTIRGGHSPDAGETPAGFPGGGVYVVNSHVKLTDVTVEDNIGGNGGGVYVDAGSAEFTRVTFQNNVAGSSGGAVGATDSAITFTDSNVVGNHARSNGGGFWNNATPTPKNVETVSVAISPNGAGSDATITGSSFSHNIASDSGGAIANEGSNEGTFLTRQAGFATLSVVNSTISDNVSATHSGGGVGGGIYSTGPLELVSDTIAGNTARLPGVPSGNLAADGDTTARNTIIANGSGQGAEDNCFGSIESKGNNLDSGDTCGFGQTSDKKNTDPKLGALRDNGGLTPTRALLDGSPAIDAGSNTAGPGLDQRGGKRPPETGSAGSTRDIGAYEAYSLGDLSIEAKGAAASVTAGQPLTYTVVARNDGPDKINGVTVSDPLPAGTTLVSATADNGSTCDGTITCNLGTLGVNQVVTITIVVTPASAGSLANTATISAAGITDTVPGNGSKSASTTVNAAPVVVVPPQQTPQDNPQTPLTPQDKSIELNIKVPKTVDLDTFFNGITVSADCGDEECLRKFREHAAVNTGATHIAGFNLTIERTSLGFKSSKTSVKLKPCISGSQNGKAHKRCVRNLRKATEKAVPFRVKVVVSAVDHSGNHIAKKAFIKVTK